MRPAPRALGAALLALGAAGRAGGAVCAAPGRLAIFLAFQEADPLQVFGSEFGYLTGGGRGMGCCAGSICSECALQTASRDSEDASEDAGGGGATATWFSCPCRKCPAGTAQPLDGQTTCAECPRGWYNEQEGQRYCFPCPPGTFSPDPGRGSACLPCAEGTYSLSTELDFRRATIKAFQGADATFDPSSGTHTCAKCPAGYFSDVQGRGCVADCRVCPPGHFSDPGAVRCEPCPTGTFNSYSAGAGVGVCLPCDAGACTEGPGAAYCFQCCPNRRRDCPAELRRGPGHYRNDPDPEHREETNEFGYSRGGGLGLFGTGYQPGHEGRDDRPAGHTTRPPENQLRESRSTAFVPTNPTYCDSAAAALVKEEYFNLYRTQSEDWRG